MAIEELGQLGRRQAAGDLREADDIREQDGHAALFRLQLRLFLADELQHEQARHVGLEPAQAAEHGVEGARRDVELAEGTAAQRRHVLDAELADGVGGGSQAADRPRQAASEQQGDQQRGHEDAAADNGDEIQPAQRGVDVIEPDIEADQPWRRPVNTYLAIEEDVGVLGVRGVGAGVDDAPDHVAVAEDVGSIADRRRPHGRQHGIADLVQMRQRLLGRQAFDVADQRRMGDHLVMAAQDERAAAGRRGGGGDETRELADGHDRHDEAAEPAALPDRHPHDDEAAVQKLDVEDVAPGESGQLRPIADRQPDLRALQPGAGASMP